MEAKDRTDVTSFDLLVRFAISALQEFNPQELREADRFAIDGIVISIGFLLEELPEDLSEPMEFDLRKFFKNGMEHIQREITIGIIKRQHMN